MVNNRSKSGVSAAAPHELNVWKFVESRSCEFEGLHTVVAKRLDNNFRSPRNKRRRTTGHDDRVAKRMFGNRRFGDLATKVGKKPPRRVRRNIELKKNPSSGFVASGDGTKRLRTHVWHAKRFTMKKLWGFYIPLGLHGRGRGSRALSKKLKHGVLVHDASYYGCVQLDGPEDILMSVLSSVLVPWKTLSQNDEQKFDDGTIIRQIWVWVHAAAFEEAYDSLSSACAKLTDPRARTKKENEIVPEEKPRALLSNDEFEIKEQITSSLTKHETECVVQYNDLWDANEGVWPPVEESVLCTEKHHRRTDFFRLGPKSYGHKSYVRGEYSRECPVLLINNETNEDSVTRCSIILLLSWVKAFWIAFVTNGANAIGIREKRWVACEIGLPHFPFDFPDCNEYSNTMAMEVVETNQKASLRPLSKRPLEIPTSPPWDCVHLILERISSKRENPFNHPAELDAKNDLNPGFAGVIARTSCIPSDCMNVDFKHLLIDLLLQPLFLNSGKKMSSSCDVLPTLAHVTFTFVIEVLFFEHRNLLDSDCLISRGELVLSN